MSTPEPQTTTGKADSALDGHWGAISPVVLLDVDGRRAVLRGSEGRCEGTVTKEDGTPVIRLKCDYIHPKRTHGKVWGLSEKSMTVDWEGFGADAFRRIECSDCASRV